jgi:hypothetical protein
VDVTVVDGDDSAKFVFWDSTLEELLGKTARVLLNEMEEVFFMIFCINVYS